jgi:hypothetical protein
VVFGVKVGEADMHSFGELAVAPVQRAAAHVVQSLRGDAAPLAETRRVSP